jgi:hypothetical protein
VLRLNPQHIVRIEGVRGSSPLSSTDLKLQVRAMDGPDLLVFEDHLSLRCHPDRAGPCDTRRSQTDFPPSPDTCPNQVPGVSSGLAGDGGQRCRCRPQARIHAQNVHCLLRRSSSSAARMSRIALVGTSRCLQPGRLERSDHACWHRWVAVPGTNGAVISGCATAGDSLRHSCRKPERKTSSAWSGPGHG